MRNVGEFVTDTQAEKNIPPALDLTLLTLGFIIEGRKARLNDTLAIDARDVMQSGRNRRKLFVFQRYFTHTLLYFNCLTTAFSTNVIQARCHVDSLSSTHIAGVSILAYGGLRRYESASSAC